MIFSDYSCQTLSHCSLQQLWLYIANNQLSDRSLQRCFTAGGGITNLLAWNESADLLLPQLRKCRTWITNTLQRPQAFTIFRSFCEQLPLLLLPKCTPTFLLSSAIHQAPESLVHHDFSVLSVLCSCTLSPRNSFLHAYG